MSTPDSISAKEIIVSVVVLAIFVGAMIYTLTLFGKESVQTKAPISDIGDKSPTHIDADIKLVSIDANKGDLTARIEFDASDNLKNEDETLKQDLKLFVNSANGKQEIDFAKGKRMTPVEGVFNMAEGQATEYPFDKYTADIDINIARAKPLDKKKLETATATDSEHPAAKDESDEDEIPIGVDFFGSIAGFAIDGAKSKNSDIDFVTVNVNVQRSGTVKFFSMFVSVLMWALAICVLLFVMSLVFRGRKIEIGMFSFLAALLFAFYAVRNSQPNVPPIGVYSDFLSFFWAEVIIALCLLIAVFTWIFRTQK